MKLNLSMLCVMLFAATSMAAVPGRKHPLDGQVKIDKCYPGTGPTCTDGYCWKTCDSVGRWCWLAWGKGAGRWATCSNDDNCNNSDLDCGGTCSC
ncbi:uncharacterized protein VTP21DRAFT_2914 [Calcarisporiella thermophila]|uniref:uncharacterized protein n=1 Tax=Calcarisporiella thermophila TaxID=911321 RepID=UPI0037433A3B